MKPENKSTNEEWIERYKEITGSNEPSHLLEVFINSEKKISEEKGYQRGKKEKYKASKAYNQGYQRGSIERHTKDAENIALVVENAKKEAYQQCKEETRKWVLKNFQFEEDKILMKDIINHLKK